jgi:hypothetical protein
VYEFGRITMDGVPYDHDVVIEQGTVQKRAGAGSSSSRSRRPRSSASSIEGCPPTPT